MSGRGKPDQGHEGFFAVDRRSWTAVCQLGINAAVAYLVLACGTGADNRTSKWSVHAIEMRTGISRAQAKVAITSLEQAGIVWRDLTGRSGRPKYKLRPAHEIPGCAGYPPAALAPKDQRIQNAMGSGWVDVPASVERTDDAQWRHWRDDTPRQRADKLVQDGYAERHANGRHYRAVRYDEVAAAKPDWIWLPNSLVGKVGQEVAPIQQAWSLHDPLTLQMLVDLYGLQRLHEDGGIRFQYVHSKFERHKVGEHRDFTVWGFVDTGRLVLSSQGRIALQPKMDDQDPAEREAARKQFTNNWNRLRYFGLVDLVAHLIHTNSEEGEIIHPMALPGTGTDIERKVTAAARRSAAAMLTDSQLTWAEENGIVALVPVKKHITDVQMVGIARLRYRPWTAPTKAFLARDEEWQKVIDTFERTVG